jgi:hypothetical protein
MATTYVLQNLPGTSYEGLSLQPFNRSAWAESSRDTANGVASIESRVAGENPTLPLVRRVSSRPAKVFHPAEGASKARPGRVFRCEVYNNVAIEDTVLGPIGNEIVQTAVEIKYSGNVILDQEKVLMMLASTLAELWDSIASGVPDDTVINRVAAGVIDID